MNWSERLYKYAEEDFIIKREDDVLTIKENNMYTYCLRTDIIEFVLQEEEDNEVDGVKKPNDYYYEMYHFILRGIEKDYVSVFSWNSYMEYIWSFESFYKGESEE